MVKEKGVLFWDCRNNKILFSRSSSNFYNQVKIFDINNRIIESIDLPKNYYEKNEFKACAWDPDSGKVISLKEPDPKIIQYFTYQISTDGAGPLDLKDRLLPSFSNDGGYGASIFINAWNVKDYLSIKDLNTGKEYLNVKSDDIKYCKFSYDNKYVVFSQFSEKKQKYEIIIWEYAKNRKKTILSTNTMTYCDWVSKTV